MREATIDGAGFTINSELDILVFGLSFWSNKGISFLPVDVYKIFPHLVDMSAAGCSLKSISKENFRGLRELQLLLLYQNEIESFAADTFEDLTSLEELDLGEKKWTQILIVVYLTLVI